MPGAGKLHLRILERYILPREKIMVAQRHHWGKIMEPVATGLAGLAAVAALTSVADNSAALVISLLWIGWTLLAGRTLWEIWQWRNEWFVATNKRMLLIYGLITYKVAMMPLGKVTDMKYARSPLGRILGYGTFVLESAGQDQAMREINWVSHPDITYLEICGILFDPDGAKPDDGPPPDEALDEPGTTPPDLVDSLLDPALSDPADPSGRSTGPLMISGSPRIARPPALPPGMRRAGEASGPTLPLPHGAWASRVPLPATEEPDTDVTHTDVTRTDVAAPPATDDAGWTVSDEARAPFVQVIPPPAGPQPPTTSRESPPLPGQ